MLEELSKFHNDWLLIALKFLRNKEDAEDLVQNLYLRLHKYNIPLKRIKYGDEINKYFIWTVLKNMSMKVLKNRKCFLNIETIVYEIEDKEEKSDINKLLDYMDKEISTWPMYEAKLFEIKLYTGLSLRNLANGSGKKVKQISNRWSLKEERVKAGTGICYRSLFDTISRGKEKIKNNSTHLVLRQSVAV